MPEHLFGRFRLSSGRLFMSDLTWREKKRNKKGNKRETIKKLIFWSVLIRVIKLRALLLPVMNTLVGVCAARLPLYFNETTIREARKRSEFS